MSATPYREDDDLRTRLDVTVLRRLAGYIGPYRRWVLVLAADMAAFALIDSFIPLLTKIAIDRHATPKRTEGLLAFAGLCLLIAVGRGITNMIMIRTGGRINTGISHDIRKDCFGHLQDLSFSYFDRRPAGWLLARITSDSEQLARMLSWGIVDIVDGAGKLLLMTVIMLALNWKLAAVVFAVVPPMAWIIWRFQRISLQRFREVREANSELSGAFNEGITGARTTKTLVREDANLQEFRTLSRRMRNVSVSAAAWSAFYLPFVLMLGTLGSAMALHVGGNGILTGEITYGTLVAFIAYAVSFFQPLQDLAGRFPQIQSAQAAAERIFSLLETEPEIRDTPDVVSRYASGPGGTPLPPFKGGLEFRNVSFRYVEEEPVLRDFSLRVKPGETIALVGETGAGKTTIVNLACRFYEPTEGTILIDGADYRSLPLAWYQSHLGIVQQSPHLFNGSIAENIRYGRLDATDDEIRTAAETVMAHTFIDMLPGNYGFEVGEEGANLSTGQKQLIALARVMLADPRLLILDEATSSIDTETEQQIQAAIDRVLAGRTAFIIAHRLSTIRSAHRILLVEDGTILEEGNHRDLMAGRGAYHRLYRSQFIREESNRLMGRRTD